eukprot:CAMPEP_0197515406 /NCGR_PEP_ID=MMETSP1318-20131121/552_1 /TAXON_ID=552666 /ORGANISM="Partenskyella glossopodia, Strain RCC365" /LENGTH=330 /DNA_ID=CAMNT_0043063773 /DNA_START=99 /DNA_END=1091 /DNA_ORIENTATION=-
MASSGLKKVFFQLDYMLSAQFTGLILAQKAGIYNKHGIDVSLVEAWTNVQRWAEAGAGREPYIVEKMYKEEQGKSVVLGCVEQNVLFEAQADGVDVMAVDAMMKGSVLAVAGSPEFQNLNGLSDLSGGTIGMHADSIQLVKALLKHQNLQDKVQVVEVTAAEKYHLLGSGKIQACQIYDVMEPLELIQVQEYNGRLPAVLNLASLAYKNQGYSQVIYSPKECVSEHGDSIEAFLAATREGWSMALDNMPESSSAVMEARKKTGTYSKSGYQDDVQLQQKCLELMAPLLGTSATPAREMIDPQEWEEASVQLAELGLLSSAVPNESSLWIR